MLPYFPFDYDAYDLPMNARALNPDRLIEVDAVEYRDELALKNAILTSDYRYYYQSLPGTEAMIWEAVEHLLPNAARHYPEYFTLAVDGDRWTWINRLLETETVFTHGDPASLPLPPLDWLGRQFQEDLILMDGAAPGTPLVAGHLCFAAGWCLDDKIGRSFLAIHDEVPQFMTRIGRPADLMMQRLKPGHPVGRVNWSIATSPDLNHAPATLRERLPTRRGITPRNAGERCYLRLERQALARLPRTRGILFTIHTYRAPVTGIVADPARLRRFTSVLKGMPRVTREYKGMHTFADALVAWLEARCRAVAGLPPTAADGGRQRQGPAGSEESTITVARVDAPSGDPLPLDPADILAGDPRPTVTWVRRNAPDEPFYRAGIWEVQPSRFRRLFTGNETCHVLAGHATVTTDGGQMVELATGHVASFPPNTVTIWTVTAPLRALFVASM